jgi:hypothetical protein
MASYGKKIIAAIAAALLITAGGVGAASAGNASNAGNAEAMVATGPIWCC